jgi:hypothetical protein
MSWLPGSGRASLGLPVAESDCLLTDFLTDLVGPDAFPGMVRTLDIVSDRD